MWSSVLADSTIPKDVDQATGLEKAELDALMAGVEVKHSKTLHNHERSCYYLPYMCACVRVCAHVCLLGLIVYCLLVDKQQIVMQICGVFQLMALLVCLFVCLFVCSLQSGSLQLESKRGPPWDKRQSEEGALHV